LTNKLSVTILTPVFNDWTCLEMLTDDIKKISKEEQHLEINIIVVDDGSQQKTDNRRLDNGIPTRILRLNRNIGHQKAIATGLSYLAEYNTSDIIIVMDSDGEDSPYDILRLIQEYTRDPAQGIIFAKRKHRQEGIIFKILYSVYKIMFRFLAGKHLTFGNFSLIPSEHLVSVCHVSEIWNHYSGGIIKANIPYSTIPVNKNRRYHGTSKMNFVSLLVHGISSFAVHLEAVSIRLLLFTSGLISISFIGICTILYIRFFTEMAIPGWASFMMLGMGSIIVQAFFMCVMLALIVLLYRSQRLFIPATDYKVFIKEIETIE
jgi:glycosyltransferase involved in cell wall biosynthesis